MFKVHGKILLVWRRITAFNRGDLSIKPYDGIKSQLPGFLIQHRFQCKIARGRPKKLTLAIEFDKSERINEPSVIRQ